MTADPASDAINIRVRSYANLVNVSPCNATLPPCCDIQGDGEDWYHAPKCPVAKALRQEWCTPKWLADRIGAVDLDPCSNDRSYIRAEISLREDDSPNGLSWVAREAARVFVNPPYGSVRAWVRQHRHTRFIYLLRWDPSTEWFGELHPHCTHIWHPGERIQFEPPPHIRASTNPFPHALYLRDPDPALLERLRDRGGYIHKVN